MNIYIANLNDNIGNDQLRQLFSGFGEVHSARIVNDVFTGVSRGFGYVEMEEEAGRAAIQSLNQTLVGDLVVTVQEAEPVQEHRGSYKVGTGSIQPYKFKKN